MPPPYAAPPPYSPPYPSPGYPYAQQRSSGHAIASMVLGIASIPMCMAYGIPSLVCGILAVVFAGTAQRDIAAGRASAQSAGMAKAGRICGWIGIGLSIAMGLIIVIAIIASVSIRP